MTKTLRLNFPQWQGGAMPMYHMGAQLLSWLAPKASGPEATVEVTPPHTGDLVVEAGIRARGALIRQTDAAAAILAEHAPDRVVVLGGDCLVDLAPFAWLGERYGDDLAILWVDAHPDVLTPAEWENAHAMVLRNLLGQGDVEFAARVKRPIKPENVMYAGLYDMSPVERRFLNGMGIGMATPGDLASGSAKVLDWLKSTGARHVAIHFDLDVIDPAQLRTLYFSRPGAAPGAFQGIPQGRMTIAEVIRLLSDVASAAEVVGLGITEFLPWDAKIIHDMLRQLPILRDER